MFLLNRWRTTTSPLLWLFPAALLAPPAYGQKVPELPSANTLKGMSVEELMDIQVTSVSRRPEKLLEAASAIQVISAEDIRRSGATSIPEALRLASNLEVAQIDSRQWAITARGFNDVFADKMLVLIDGRSVYTSLYGGVYWDVQNTLMEDLDRIEVISGPGGTQWGANAVNGVININTKSAKDTQGGLVVSESGTELRAGGAFRYGGQLSQGLYYRVYGKYFELDDSVLPDGSDAADGWRVGQGGFRLDWDQGTGDVVTFQGDLYSSSIGQTGLHRLGVSGGNVLGRWTRSLSNTSEIKAQIYYDYTFRRLPGLFTHTQKSHIYDLDLQHSVTIGDRHAIVWGLGARVEADEIQNSPESAFLPPAVTRATYDAFVQDEVTLYNDLHLTLGSKFEHSDYTGYEFEPSVRVAWSPLSNQTFWGAFSRAVRTPSRIDRDLYSPATPPYQIAGGRHVLSETLLAFELGYRVQVDPQLAFSLSTFHHRYDDVRSIQPLNPPDLFPVEISSGARARSWGAELSADWRATPVWRIHAGYTYLGVVSDARFTGMGMRSDRSTPHDPEHQLLLRSYWDLSSAWEFDFGLRYISSIANQDVPGYVEGDVHLSWKPSVRWELSLVGQNLLHRQHSEFNTPGSRREIQRSVYTKLLWRF